VNTECDWCAERPAVKSYTMKENGGGWFAGTKLRVCWECLQLLTAEGG
jgi:hypothetical protein